MRDAKEIWHFPDPANDDVVMRLTKPNTYRRTARGAASVPDFFCNAAQSFGKEWETVCVRTKTKTMKAIENIVSDLS